MRKTEKINIEYVKMLVKAHYEGRHGENPTDPSNYWEHEGCPNCWLEKRVASCD